MRHQHSHRHSWFRFLCSHECNDHSRSASKNRTSALVCVVYTPRTASSPSTLSPCAFVQSTGLLRRWTCRPDSIRCPYLSTSTGTIINGAWLSRHSVRRNSGGEIDGLGYCLSYLDYSKPYRYHHVYIKIVQETGLKVRVVHDCSVLRPEGVDLLRNLREPILSRVQPHLHLPQRRHVRHEVMIRANSSSTWSGRANSYPSQPLLQ